MTTEFQIHNKDIIATSIVWLNYGCRKVQKYGGVQPFQGHVEAKFQSFILVFLQKEKKNWGCTCNLCTPLLSAAPVLNISLLLTLTLFELKLFIYTCKTR